MTETLSLSLQAFPPPDKEKESLKYLIQRINEQRGSFRNVTERSLEEEIRQLEAGAVDGNQEGAEESTAVDENIETKKEEVTKAREDIHKYIGQAANDSHLALEFVSLLLSKLAPAAAQTTISPALKQLIPLGSLGAEIVQPPQVSAADKYNESMTVIGWRMQSLNGAVDSLLNSASRLEQEMDKEARYWEQVLAVKEKGWSLHRLPREQHTLGVRYGFAEAYPDFRDRGLAALRRDDNGNLSLDRGIRHKGDRKLRVRILQLGKPIASNVRDSSTSNHDTDSVERQILTARDSLFDEELHHEMVRESRNLVNQGVRCIDDSILLPYEAGKQIELTLVPVAEGSSDEATSDDYIADAIALALRILLSHAHRQNLQQRSKMPLPLREQKPSRPIYALLKPVLEYLQHRSYVDSIYTFLQGIHKTLNAAGIDLSISKETSTSKLSTTSIPPKQPPTSASSINQLLQTLTGPLTTTFTLTLALTPSSTIHLTTHTTLHPPHFGTTFHISTPSPNTIPPPNNTTNPPPNFPPPPPPPLPTFPALSTHLTHLLTLSLLNHLTSKSPTWRPISPHDTTVLKTQSGKNGNDRSEKDSLSLNLSKDQLDMRHHILRRDGKEMSKPEAGGVWIWKGGDGEGEGESAAAAGNREKRLFEIFESLS